MIVDELARWSFLAGLSYLQGMVVYSLITVDLRRQGDDKKAVNYYQSRKQNTSYKIVPVACTCLTAGLLANVWVRSADLVSLAQLGIAFGTALNNGTNVVDPANSLAEKKGHETAILSQITKGHLIDAIGFTVLFCVGFVF
jgi:hypothetical protein